MLGVLFKLSRDEDRKVKMTNVLLLMLNTYKILLDVCHIYVYKSCGSHSTFSFVGPSERRLGFNLKIMTQGKSGQTS